MKRNFLIVAALSATAIVLNGCCTPVKKTADILKEDDSKIAMTINKDFTSTKINVNTGERMKPCRTDIPKGKSLKELRDVIAECLPKGHKNGIGEVQVHGEYMLFKGSECFADVVGGYLFVYCQPPEDLGF